MDKYELYVRMGYSKLVEQRERNRTLEVKSAALLAGSMTLAAATVLLLNKTAMNGSSLWPNVWIGFLGASFLVVLCCALMGLKPIGWRNDPDIRDLSRHLSNYHDSDLAEWTGHQYRNAIVENNPKLEAKSRYVTGAVFGLGFLAASLLALVFIHRPW